MQYKNDRSYGIIPMRVHRGVVQLLIVQHLGGHWSFPKGHPEKGETSKEAAIRELKEETGLSVSSFLDIPTFEEEYTFYHRQQKIHKKVLYFPAYVEGQQQKQEEEIKDLLWCELHHCCERLSFKQAKEFCLQLQDQMPVYLEKMRNP